MTKAKAKRSSSQRRRFWSADEHEYLRKHYADSSTKEIAQHLDRTISKVLARANKLGLRKSEAYMRNPEFNCRLQPGTSKGSVAWFPKGNIPFNKGLRRPGWAPGRMRETQFKKGDRSGKAAQNWKPIGTILPDTEGYLRIKVREAVHGEATGFGDGKVWPFLQRHIWEQANGPVPPKHLIIFKDGDKGNCALENLACMSMADNARRNTMWARYPRELAEAIQLVGALKRRLRKKNAE